MRRIILGTDSVLTLQEQTDKFEEKKTIICSDAKSSSPQCSQMLKKLQK